MPPEGILTRVGKSPNVVTSSESDQTIHLIAQLTIQVVDQRNTLPSKELVYSQLYAGGFRQACP